MVFHQHIRITAQNVLEWVTNSHCTFALYLPKKLKENQQRLVKHWNEKHL